MGNSNHQPTQSSQPSPTPSLSSLQSLPPLYNTPLYGIHSLNHTPVTTVLKTYKILAEEDNRRFQELIGVYGKIKCQNVVSIVNVEAKEGEGWEYTVQMEWCRVSLKDQMQNKKQRRQRYTTQDILKLLKDVLTALITFQSSNLPLTPLSPSTVGLLTHPHLHYTLTSSPLIHPESYLSSPPHFTPQNILNSLALIVIQMVTEQYPRKERLEEMVERVRNDVEFEVGEVLEEILEAGVEKKIGFQDVLRNVRESQNRRIELRENKDSKFVRGYNCPKQVFFFDKNTVSSAARAKLSKILSNP